MRKKGKIAALIVSASLLVAGLAIAALGVAFMWKNSHFLSKNTFKSETVDVTEEVGSINVFATTCDVIFEVSPDGSSYVSALIPEKCELEAFITDNVLHVNVKDTRKWYDHIGISFGTDSPNVVIYMPKGEYEDLTVNVTTGDLKTSEDHSFTSLSFEASTGDAVISSPVKELLVANVTTGDVTVGGTSPSLMEIKATTGDVKIQHVSNSGKITAKTGSGDITLSSMRSNELDIKTTTGDITLNDVIAAEITHVETTSGYVSLTAFDSKAIYIDVTTGDVKGELLSGKTFTTDTTTGDVRVPYSTEGGVCDIKTTTGDIIITLTNP